ncbi:RING finger protein 122 isoform X1 [Scleropages formosus]|nr:RING finger protein 122-like isoform X1 [Scleropages formosus]
MYVFLKRRCISELRAAALEALTTERWDWPVSPIHGGQSTYSPESCLAAIDERPGSASAPAHHPPRAHPTPTPKAAGLDVFLLNLLWLLGSGFMHPFQWCNGCLCGLGLQSSYKYCEMMSEDIYHLPLNVYIIVLGIGLFIFMLSMIFCCYLFRLRRQGTREQYGYNEVVLKGAGKKLSLLGQTCAVCLEEFRSRDELGVCPCTHAFHKKCLVKWLEIRSVCPMCNKPICRLQADAPQGAEGPQDPQEV